LRKFYTTKQIAEICGVHITTAIRWIDSGQVRAFRTPGGRRRVAADELKGFLERLKIPIELRGMGGRPHILVVDDDELVLRSTARLLNNAKRYEVSTASSGYDALLMIGKQPPDLVLLDLLMPRVDGFEVCRSIKKSPSGGKIAVICVTGRFSADVARRVKELGADGCYGKEDVAERLVEIVDAALS
jgi:two-component system OmpR family response regulator